MKPAQSLFIGGLIAALGLPVLPSVAQVKNTQVNALVEALKQAAPPNRPQDGMYSPWQVLPGIIPSWTQQCLKKEMTPQQFEANENLARQVVSCIVRRELQTQAATPKDETQSVKGVACWWMTGKSQGCNKGTTATYVQRVLSFYQRQVTSLL